MKINEPIKNNSSRRSFLSKLFGLAAGTTIVGSIANMFVPKATRANSNKTLSSEPFMGEIAMVGFNYTPVGYVACNGGLMQISQYNALYSLLGTNFGGNGRSDFGIPDLRGRVPLHQGSNGSSSYSMGQFGGQETTTLDVTDIPAHDHEVRIPVSTSAGNSYNPEGKFPAVNNEGIKHYSSSSNAYSGTITASPTGLGAPHYNMQPFTVVNFIMATEGVYPSRS